MRTYLGIGYIGCLLPMLIYLEEKKKLEILAFQRFSMRRIACHYLSLILFSLYFFPLSPETRPSLHQPSPDRFLAYQ